MRGHRERSGSLFSYVSIEERIPDRADDLVALACRYFMHCMYAKCALSMSPRDGVPDLLSSGHIPARSIVILGV